jgi:hypothetical protein
MHYWSAARSVAGMTILAAVFVVAQGLLSVQELAQGPRRDARER